MARFSSPKNQDRLCVPRNIQFKKKSGFIPEDKTAGAWSLYSDIAQNA